MTKIFPIKLERTVDGPIELLAFAGAAIAGGYVGWNFGSDLIEYANQVTPNTDALSEAVKEYATLTKLATLYAGAKVCGKAGSLVGRLFDKIRIKTD